MSPRDLTDRFLKSLTPPTEGRIEIPDARRPGLRLRLYASGRATWMYEKRVKGGKNRKHTFGTWPEPISLSEARVMALEIEAEAAKGIDRVAEGKAKQLEEEAAIFRQLKVRTVLDAYNDLHLSNLKGGKERYAQLKNALKASLDRPICDMTRADIQAAVDAKAAEGRKTHANRIRSALLAFSKWAWGREYIEQDIGVGISKASKETARERAPTVLEVRRIWDATFNMGDLWGPALRLMILTAQRRGEILELLWSEVDFDRAQIIKPGSRTKNGKPHITHLSAPALSELAEMKRKIETGEAAKNDFGFVFTTTGHSPPSGVSKAKARLDKSLGGDFEPWHLHDLRTSFSTAMAESGIPESVADRILNHSACGSAPSAVARVYNKAEMLPQRAAALDRWANMVTGQ
ncbi:MAG: tyrosine-type recombinase/integrase, partial [Pseudomonadota bacterium]